MYNPIRWYSSTVCLAKASIRRMFGFKRLSLRISEPTIRKRSYILTFFISIIVISASVSIARDFDIDLILNKYLASYYQPPASKSRYQIDAPLSPLGTLTIGYGSGGAAPLTYSLREGQNVDVGFLKLFLTTRPTNFSKIQQDTSFGPQGHRGLQELPKINPDDEWDTVTITVVQRRPSC